MPYPNKSGDVIRTYLSLERDFKDQAAKLTEQRNGVRKGRLGMDWGGGVGLEVSPVPPLMNSLSVAPCMHSNPTVHSLPGSI